MQSEQRVIISGKVNRRSDDEPPSIIVETVKTVDNSNIFTITLLDDFRFEEVVLLKNILCQHSGSDPVMFKLKDLDEDVKILTASIFWVESTNDLVNQLKKQFPNRLEIDVRSMDTNDKDENTEEAVAV